MQPQESTAREAVRRHYEAHWGPPARTAWFSKGAHEIEVYKWDAARHPAGVNLYATIGASAYPMPDHPTTHRMEFYIGLSPAADEVASPLAALGLYPVFTGHGLDYDHTVPAEDPLWPGAEMSSMLISYPFEEVIPPLALPDGVHIQFLMVIPLYPSERTFKMRYGAEALWQEWAKTRVPFWDPMRPDSQLPTLKEDDPAATEAEPS